MACSLDYRHPLVNGQYSENLWTAFLAAVLTVEALWPDLVYENFNGVLVLAMLGKGYPSERTVSDQEADVRGASHAVGRGIRDAPGRHGWHLLRLRVGGELSVAHGVMVGNELGQSVGQDSLVRRVPAIEAEDELIEEIREMRVAEATPSHRIESKVSREHDMVAVHRVRR